MAENIFLGCWLYESLSFFEILNAISKMILRVLSLGGCDMKFLNLWCWRILFLDEVENYCVRDFSIKVSTS